MGRRKRPTRPAHTQPSGFGFTRGKKKPRPRGEGGQGFKLNVTTTNMRKCSMQSCDGRHRQIGSIVSAPDPKTKLAEVRERSTTSGAATYQKYKAAAVRNGGWGSVVAGESSGTSSWTHGLGYLGSALRREGLIAHELILQLSTLLRSRDLFLELRARTFLLRSRLTTN
jgi:hypothetical protein